jgi:molybdopterin molybdotransferase
MTRTNVTPEEALACIVQTIVPLESEIAALDDALDRVLTEDIRAPCSLPPFANAGMDGYAVRAADIAAAARDAPARLRVLESVSAGAAATQAIAPGTAARIMTGAPLPPGAEVVVPLEETHALEDGTVLVYQALPAGRHLRPAGEDIHVGELAIAAGQVLRPQEIGLLAALGYTEVAVVRRPRVAILSTGDELLEAGQPLAPGKVRDSNAPALAALVRRAGGVPLRLGIARDTAADLHASLERARAQHADLILTSAGASGGDYDLIKTLLENEGMLHFWLVDMKPGRPLLFGQLAGTPLVGLPGNPAAALIGAELFVRPALLRMSGRTAIARPTVCAVLEEAIMGGPRRHYVRGVVRRSAEGYRAAASRGSLGAGSLTGLVHANALLVVPAGTRSLPAGSEVEAIMLDWPEAVF